MFKYTKYITPDSTTTETTNNISKSDEMLIRNANKAKEAKEKEDAEKANETKENTQTSEANDITKEEYIKLQKEITDIYNEKIANRNLRITYKNGETDETEDLSYTSLLNSNSDNGGYRITDKSGNIVVPSTNDIPETATKIADIYYSSDGKKYVIMEELSNQTAFQTALWNGEILIQKAETDESNKTTWSDTDYTKLSFIDDVLYTEDDALAEAKYEEEMQKLKEDAYLKYLSE